MELRDYLRIMRKSWALILLCTLLATAAAAAVTLLMTPKYEGKVQLFVSTSDQSVDNTSGLNQGAQFSQQRVKSYADIVTSPKVTQPVIDKLNLPYTADQLAKEISADAPLDTVLINVSVKDPVPARAAAIANAVGDQFSKVVGDLERPESGGPSPVRVSVVKQADVPTAPVSPRTKLNIALGLLVGLAVGIGGAVLRETLDTTVKGSEEIHEMFDLPTLGVVAYDPDAAAHPLVVQSDPHSTRAEAFRQLRTNLQFANIDGDSRCLVFTSAVPAEGKTTSTCNLAITMAQAGLRVLLVEADLRRSAVANYLGIEDAVGITSVLIGRADLADAIQPWGDNLLHVLPGGPKPPNPSELLGSQAMTNLLNAAKTMYDVVLIDAPPLLPVTDAAVVSTVADGAILVVRHGKTKREQVKRSLEALAAVDARLLGVVLNMAPTKGPDVYYYGYGYRYMGPDGGRATPPLPAPVPEPKATVGEPQPYDTATPNRHAAETRLRRANTDEISFFTTGTDR